MVKLDSITNYRLETKEANSVCPTTKILMENISDLDHSQVTTQFELA